MTERLGDGPTLVSVFPAEWGFRVESFLDGYQQIFLFNSTAKNNAGVVLFHLTPRSPPSNLSSGQACLPFDLKALSTVIR